MIYFIEAIGIGHIKIGYTDGDDVLARLATLQTASPVPLKVLATIDGSLEDEKNLHRRFAAFRVSGEWFQAAPELLAVIPAVGLPSLGKHQVIEQSVAIRVLTVGRKQFTRSLLGQLPMGRPIEWKETVLQIASQLRPGIEIRHVAAAASLKEWVVGDVWGWLKGETGDLAEAWSATYKTTQFRWIIFALNGMLYKFPDVTSAFARAEACGWNNFGSKVETEVLVELYPKRLELIGWRDCDQLFMGI